MGVTDEIDAGAVSVTSCTTMVHLSRFDDSLWLNLGSESFGSDTRSLSHSYLSHFQCYRSPTVLTFADL